MNSLLLFEPTLKKVLGNENGSAIVIALLALVVVTIIGITSITISKYNIEVANNDILYKKAFYAADGGTELTRELIEENLSCPLGFPDNVHPYYDASGTQITTSAGHMFLEQTESFLRVTDLDFAYQEDEDDVDDNANGNPDFPDNDEHDIWFGDSQNYSLSDYDRNADGEVTSGDFNHDRDGDGTNDSFNIPQTNTVAFGDTQLSTGSAIQMAAGYEGKGKGAASGGGKIVYEVHSQYEYPARNSTSYIMVEYRHIIGQEGTCNF